MRNTEDSILIVLLIVTSMNLVSANQENQIKDNYIVKLKYIGHRLRSLID